jgi:hypothetical protein
MPSDVSKRKQAGKELSACIAPMRPWQRLTLNQTTSASRHQQQLDTLPCSCSHKFPQAPTILSSQTPHKLYAEAQESAEPVLLGSAQPLVAQVLTWPNIALKASLLASSAMRCA